MTRFISDIDYKQNLFFRFIYYDTLQPDKFPSYGYSDMIDLVVDGHHNTLTRKSCEILMKRGMYRVENNKYMFARDVRLKVTKQYINIYYKGTVHFGR